MNTPYDQEFFADKEDGAHYAASIVMPLVLNAFPAASLVDVGCGLGNWLGAAEKAGVGLVDGYDGAYVDEASLHIPPDRFHPVDLTTDFVLGREYDLAMSLEVAEHLPEGCARRFVERLTQASRVVLFSAAIPGQGGTAHVNERWQDYWRGLFKEFGFEPVDLVRPVIWGDRRIPFWYQQNIIVYCQKSVLEERPDLSAVSSGTTLNVVHPDLYCGKVEQSQMYLSKVVRMLPGLLVSAVRRRIGATA